ncbi:hypothetical protein MPNT_60073 [Candidatus Methylacidithermus pantelleriae]|uniref:Uncharacterized protein n=1 Tax=Candidatus Methylacidithermus pantelleriae TaxID=2744239 RepID=A0A8J2FPL8_9BACT|nr:hypothetical protein MPNT_60073 [Candidatus Methylacidithermus pantelleriae]
MLGSSSPPGNSAWVSPEPVQRNVLARSLITNPIQAIHLGVAAPRKAAIFTWQESRVRRYSGDLLWATKKARRKRESNPR